MGVMIESECDVVIASESGATEEEQAVQEGDLLLREGASAV